MKGMPPRRTSPRPDEASASSVTTNVPNLPFISSEIAMHVYLYSRQIPNLETAMALCSDNHGFS